MNGQRIIIKGGLTPEEEYLNLLSLSKKNTATTVTMNRLADRSSNRDVEVRDIPSYNSDGVLVNGVRFKFLPNHEQSREVEQCGYIMQ